MARATSVNASAVEGWRSSVDTRAENSSRPQCERLSVCRSHRARRRSRLTGISTLARHRAAERSPPRAVTACFWQAPRSRYHRDAALRPV
jgi:hypothetical protein